MCIKLVGELCRVLFKFHVSVSLENVGLSYFFGTKYTENALYIIHTCVK